MYEILDFRKTINTRVMPTNIYSDDGVILLETTDYIGDCRGPIKYTGIYEINYLTKNMNKFKFNVPADIISLKGSCDVIYYGYINTQKSNYCVNLHKINCRDWSQEYILTIDTEISIEDNRNYKNLAAGMVGINERYSVLSISYPIPNQRSLCCKTFLIDSLEKKLYPIGIGTDTLFLQDPWFISNSDYIGFKTGKIQPYEKRDFWLLRKKDGVTKEYKNHEETIILCKVNELIKIIKEGLKLNSNWTIEKCDSNCTIDSLNKTIDSNINKVIYSVEHFEKNITEIKIIEMEDHSLVTTMSEGFYDNLMYSNNKVFGIKRFEDFFDIYDVNSKDKLFSIDEDILFIDEEVFITLKFSVENFNRIVTVRNLSNQQSISAFECHSVYCDYEKNILVLT